MISRKLERNIEKRGYRSKQAHIKAERRRQGTNRRIGDGEIDIVIGKNFKAALVERGLNKSTNGQIRLYKRLTLYSLTGSGLYACILSEYILPPLWLDLS